MTPISGSNIQHFIICITVWDTTCHDFKNTRLNYHFETKLCHSQLTINQWCSESCNPPPLVALAPTKKGHFHRKMGKQKRKLSLIYTHRNVVPVRIIICFEHMPSFAYDLRNFRGTVVSALIWRHKTTDSKTEMSSGTQRRLHIRCYLTC